MGDKKIFRKKYGVTGLFNFFKIHVDVIDSKKWVQQNSATLIYDLNTMEGKVESYLKKNPFKTVPSLNNCT